eukprot:gene29296-36321_t
MLTDRSAVSTQDGSSGWNSFNEADQALLSFGWHWEADTKWEIDMTGSNVDAEGWTYNSDFEVDRLSTLFLEKLALASVIKHPRQLSEPKIVQLKNGLIDVLGFIDKRERTSSTASNSPLPVAVPVTSAKNKVVTAATADSVEKLSEMGVDETPPPQLSPVNDIPASYVYDREVITRKLDTFANQSKTALSMASSVLSSSNASEALSLRLVEVSRLYFGDEERAELARLLIRKFDSVYEFHCEKLHCGDSCQFSVELCPHSECGVRYSRKWAAQHDGMCPQKIVPCTRECGVDIKRRFMDPHLCQDCVLRPVVCAFTELGCKSDLLFKDLDGHMHDCQCHHLELSLGRLKEHQGVITALHNRVRDLEVQNAQHVASITTLQAGAAAATAALLLHERKQDKALKDAIYSAEQKASRRTADLSSELHGEINKLKRVLNDMNKPIK